MTTGMSLPARIEPKEIRQRFRWKASDGKLYYVEEMATSHLFNVMRMIWNHSMPEEAKSVSYNRYIFTKHYTPEYMAEALENIIPALFERPDLDPYDRAELDGFIAYLQRRNAPKEISNG